MESFIFQGKGCQAAGEKGQNGWLPRFLVSDCWLKIIESRLACPFVLWAALGCLSGIPCLPSRPRETLGLSTEHAGMDYVLPQVRADAGSRVPGGGSLPSFSSKQALFMTQDGILSEAECASY